MTALAEQAAELAIAGFDGVFYGPAALDRFEEFLAQELSESETSLLA